MLTTIPMQIDHVVREKLNRADLLGDLDQARTNTFPSPPDNRIHIVFRDAVVLERAEKAIEEARLELEKRGIGIVPNVRALWKVEDVQKVEVNAQLPEGLGIVFRALLRSGHYSQEVWVSVAPFAFRILKPFLDTHPGALERVVRQFLELSASLGRELYWEIHQKPYVEIDETSVFLCLMSGCKIS